MEKKNLPDENVKINLPVEVEYVVLNELLNQKFRGKILSKGKENRESSNTAKIEEISLQRGLEKGFALSLKLKIKLLTTFFRNKEVEMLVHISPEFHPENEEIYVETYKIDVQNNGWIINNLLEGLINSFLYNKLKNKMKFNLQPLLQSKVDEFNEKLSTGLEIKDGVNLLGEVNSFRIEKIIFEEHLVLIFLKLSARNEIKIKKISF